MKKGKRNASRNLPDGPVQERAIHTRQELLHAARRIFARDGFEGARLQDIAESAGKTRGALYVHFKDKEDLFFALIAKDLAEDDAVFQKKLRSDSTRAERIAVFTEHLESFVRNRHRALLYVEFKLYATRHPRRRERLAKLHAAMCGNGVARKLQLLPELATTRGTERRRMTASFGAVLDGLSLNHYFDPVGLTDGEIHCRIEQAVRERFGGLGVRH